jgi:hypothetical protein
MRKALGRLERRSARRPASTGNHKDWEQPTLAEQAHKHHKSTDPSGQTKKQHKVVAEVKRHPRPLRMGGTNIAPQ